MRKLIAFGLFALLVSPVAARAGDLVFQTIGSYIQQSAVIALVDAKKSGSPDYQAVLEFREFLKGRAGPSERTISVKWGCIHEGIYVQPDSDGVAVLLPEGWQHIECPLLAVYQKPNDVAALRTLVGIYAVPSERSRLEALRALVNNPNPLFGDQFFHDLSQMREPVNFQIILDLFDTLNIAGQRRVVKILEGIGDIRGVPTLLKALKSPETSLQVDAAETLSTYFRGAPRVNEALPKVRKNVGEQPQTRFQTATRLWESGRRERGRALFLAVAKDRDESDYVRVQSVLRIASTLSQSERSALQVAMQALLARRAEQGNYFELLDAAKILRTLRSQENLDLLTALIERKQDDFVYQDTPFISIMAIRDLGPQARHSAAEELIARIKGVSKTNRNVGEPEPQLLALALLGDDAQVGRVENWRWGSLRPLVAVGQKQDEGLFLIRVLQNHSDLPRLALAGIAFRMGDLRDKRSVIDLIRLLTRGYSGAESSAAHALG
jgi:HEAT repeat protein